MAEKSSVCRIGAWYCVGEVSGDIDSNRFAVVQLEPSLQMLVPRAIKGKIDYQGLGSFRLLVNANKSESRTLNPRNPFKLTDGEFLTFRKIFSQNLWPKSRLRLQRLLPSVIPQ